MPVLNQPVVAYAIADRIAAGAHEIAFAPTQAKPPGRCVTTSPKTSRPSSPRGAATPSTPCSPTCTTAATPRPRRCPSRSRDTRRARRRHRSRHRRPPLRRPGTTPGQDRPSGARSAGGEAGQLRPTKHLHQHQPVHRAGIARPGGAQSREINDTLTAAPRRRQADRAGHAADAAVKSGTPEQAGTRRPRRRQDSRPRPRPPGQVSTRLRRRPATARPMPRSSRTAPPAAIQATGAPVIGRPPPLPPSELLLATVTAAVTA